MTTEVEESLQTEENNGLCNPQAPRRKPWVGVCVGVCLVVAGVLTLWLAAAADTVALSGEPWKDALIFIHIPKDLSAAETLPVRVRLVERVAPLESDTELQLMGELVQWNRFENMVRLSDPEWVIALDLPEHKLRALLESGRLPEPGQPEVLAGDLARSEEFQVDGITFKVVGTLKRSVSVFLFSYLLPYSSDFANLFTPERGAREGVLVEEGRWLIDDNLLPELYSEPEGDTEEEDEGVLEEGEEVRDQSLVLPNYLGGIMRAPGVVTLQALVGMILIAFGGACFHFYLFKRLHAGKGVFTRPFLAEVLKRPKLFWGMNFFFYGIFFWTMWTAINNPLLAYRTKLYIELVFSKGGLGHIGAAYDSGIIAHAAWMTFYNNFIEQTLGFTFLVSLIPIPLGLIKNLLSFMLVGGAMSPLWVGAAETLTMHSLTMALELEAYILACFAITAWPLTLLAGLWSRQFKAALKSGALMLLSAMLVTGVMLAIAALYEALTLIHFI